MEIQEIADGVYVLAGRYVEERRGLILSTAEGVLIDAPRHFDEADALKELAEESTEAGVRKVILTHGHLDHVATLQVFDGATVIATAGAREYMAGKGQRELERMREGDEELQCVRQVLPAVGFTGEGLVYLESGRTLRCLPAPGHSPDSQLVLLEPDGILFGGDTLSALVPPYFPDGSSRELQDSLRRLKDIGAKILVPGHGPLLHGEEIAREATLALTYLERLRGAVDEGLSRGEPPEALQEHIRWEDCSEKNVPAEDLLHYHQENVMRMAAEVQEGARM